MICHTTKHGLAILSCLVVLFVIVLIGIATIRSRGSSEIPGAPRDLLRTIRESGAHVKNSDAEYGPIGGYSLYIWLQIDPSGVTRVLNSRAFEKFGWVSLWKGNLYWGNVSPTTTGNPRDNPLFGKNTDSIAPYTGDKGVPEWFKPNDWVDPNVYVSKEKWGKSKRYRTQVFVYNDATKEAYLVDDLAGH
jgi:hypothetical protein